MITTNVIVHVQDKVQDNERPVVVSIDFYTPDDNPFNEAPVIRVQCHKVNYWKEFKTATEFLEALQAADRLSDLKKALA